MASYQLRLERKKKFKEMILGYKFVTSLYWEWVKSKFSSNKEFYQTIIDDINTQLESGVTEVRYYIYSGLDMYESLEESYEFYKNSHPNEEYVNYCEDFYTIVTLHVQQYFNKFDDIEFQAYDKDMCSYFSIKTKF